MGGNRRTTLAITGSIARVSSDITREQQNSSQPAKGVLDGSHRSAGSGACLSARYLPRFRHAGRGFHQDHERSRSSTCSNHFKSRLHGPFASDDRTRAGQRKFANREPCGMSRALGIRQMHSNLSYIGATDSAHGARACSAPIESGGFSWGRGWESLSALIRFWEAGRCRMPILGRCGSV
jgi:hypothetical protein